MADPILSDIPAATIETDPYWYAQGDRWSLKQEGWDPDRSLYFETIFSIANGYMGFRGYREEMDNHRPAIREGYLAGMFAKLPPIARKLVVHDYEWDSRQMVSLPSIFTALVTLDGEAFSPYDGQLEGYCQEFDMRTGMLTRSVVWESSSGKKSRLKFLRLLSAETPHLAIHRIEVEPLNWSGAVEIWWDYDVCERTVFRCGDPAKANHPCALVELLGAEATEDTVSGLVRTVGSEHEISISSRVSEGPVESSAANTGVLSQLGRSMVRKGETVSWNRYTAVCTSRDTGIHKPRERLGWRLGCRQCPGFRGPC
jgi:trehalose/maltose hydrolase-like predicted phosphorylase